MVRPNGGGCDGPGEDVAETIHIRRLQTIGDREIQGLSEVLIDCVERGASVSFMFPMDDRTY